MLLCKDLYALTTHLLCYLFIYWLHVKVVSLCQKVPLKAAKEVSLSKKFIQWIWLVHFWRLEKLGKSRVVVSTFSKSCSCLDFHNIFTWILLPISDVHDRDQKNVNNRIIPCIYCIWMCFCLHYLWPQLMQSQLGWMCSLLRLVRPLCLICCQLIWFIWQLACEQESACKQVWVLLHIWLKLCSSLSF